VRDRGSDFTPPRETVLRREDQAFSQDHFTYPPPPPSQQYEYFPQAGAPQPDFPFDDFIQIPGIPQPRDPQPQPSPADSGPSAQSFSCGPCGRTFSQTHEFNRHMKRHDRRYECPFPNCTNSGFPSSQDRDRHIKSKHPETVSWEQLQYCPVQTCRYTTKGFTRTDNFRRHMKLHPEVNE